MRLWNKRPAGRFLAPFIIIVILSVIRAFSVFAADGLPRLADMAGILSDSEWAELSEKLDEISERQQVDVVVVTAQTTDGEPAGAYADDFYDYNGYGFGDGRDGILLLVSMDERDWYISTTGFGITAFTDAGREYIAEKILEDLSMDDYAAAFTNFADLCDDFITQARTGEPYDEDHLPKESFGVVGSLAAAFVIAFIVSLIVTGVMKGQLKTVHSQSKADSYMIQGSLQLTKKNDLFLYRNVDRRKKEEKKESDNPGGSRTHTSSSGTTHGGGGGKF